MFKVDDIEVYFKHYPKESGLIDGNSKTKIPYVGKTLCIVQDFVAGELLSEGESFCSINDLFNRSTGRKKSMSRAIQNMDKETRTKLWNKYIETTSQL